MNPKTATESKQLAVDKHSFETLYYGPMVIVEGRSEESISTATDQSLAHGKYTADADVEKRMIEFYKCAFENQHCSNPRNLALALADSCRVSLAKRSSMRVEELQKNLPMRRFL